MRYIKGYINRYNVVVLCITIVLWFLIAPPSVGGFTTFNIVNGISMLPTMRLGDLALVRRAPSYQVGDVIVYKDASYAFVIHRIVGQQGNTFIMRGDNNTWFDYHQPTSDEVVGKLWFFIPGGGLILQELRSYFLVAIALCLAVMLAFWYRDRQHEQPLSRRQRHDQRRLRQAANANAGSSKSLNADVWILGAVAAVSLCLALAAFAQPLTKDATIPVSYQQLVNFSYATTDRAGIYDDATVASGEPIYRAASDSLDLTMHYVLSGTQVQALGGTYAVSAIVSDATGWQRRLDLAQPSPFSGGTFTRTVTLDLNAIQGLIDAYENTLAIKHNTYRVAVVPTVQIDGVAGNMTWQDSLTSQLVFSLDDTALTPLAIDRSRPAATDGQMASAQIGSLKLETSQPVTLNVLGAAVPIEVMRVISALGLVVSGLGAAALFIVRHLHRRMDASATVPRAYRRLIVAAENQPLVAPSDKPVVEMPAIIDLLRFARSEGRAVLFTRRANAEVYTIVAGAVMYRCVVPVA